MTSRTHHSPVVAVVLFAMAALALLTGVAAAAGPTDTPLPGSARVGNAARTLFAGETANVDLTVLATGVQPLNWIAITPGTGVTIQPGASAPGWTASAPVNNRVVFTGGSAMPGIAQTFTIPVTVRATNGSLAATDRSIRWVVEGSSNAGVTKRQFTEAVSDAGALVSTVRVLKVLSGPAITSPAGAKDGTVTAGQILGLGTTVKNLGSGTLTAKAVYAATNATVGSEPAHTLAPGDTADFATTATTGSTGTTSFSVTIATATSDAVAAASGAGASTIQAPVVIACTGTSPSITNASPRQFEATITKSGEPAATLGTIVLSGGEGFTSPEASASVPAGAATSLPAVKFPAFAPTIADGVYNMSLQVSGLDANDAPISATVPCGSKIRVDRAAPTVTLDAPQLPLLGLGSAPTQRQSAAKNGDAIGYAGTITDNGGCIEGTRLTAGRVRQFDASGAELGSISFTPAAPVTIVGDTCRFSGSIENVQFAASAASFAIGLTAEDAAGIPGVGSSASSLVDNVAPTYTAKTLALGTIEITFSECVSGGSVPLQWAASSKSGVMRRTTEVTPANCSTNGSAMKYRGLSLTLPEALAGVDDRPSVVYVADGSAAGSAPTLAHSLTYDGLRGYVDGAGNALPWMSAKAVDGIAPPVAVVDAVSPGLEFHTNGGSDLRPTVTLSNVVEHNTVCLFEDLDGSNTISQGDAKLTATCPAVAAGATTIAVKLSEALSGPDRQIAILSSVSDGPNTTAGTPKTIAFDRTGSTVSAATIAPDDGTLRAAGLSADAIVEVTFDEALGGGTDAADDWAVYDANGEHLYGVTIAGVDACTSGGSKCRIVYLDTGATNAWEQVARIAYAPQTGRAYTDRAGNAAAASSAAVSEGSASGAPSPIERLV